MRSDALLITCLAATNAEQVALSSAGGCRRPPARRCTHRLVRLTSRILQITSVWRARLRTAWPVVRTLSDGRLRAVRNTDHGSRIGFHPRCCSIFSTMCSFGTTPTTVSTCWPFLKKRMLGIERTLKRTAVS